MASLPAPTRPRPSGAVRVLVVVGGGMLSAGLAAVASWIAANGLGPVGFGLFSLGMAVMTILLEVGGPALDTAVVRFAGPLVTQQPMQAEAYFRAGFVIKLATSGFLSLALLALAAPLAQALSQPEVAPVLRWMALCLLLANLSSGPLARLQSAEQFLSHSLLRVFSNALKVVLMAAILWAGWLTPANAAAAWTATFAATAVVGWLMCHPQRGPRAKLALALPMREIFDFARWAMLSGLLFAVHIRTDMLLLGHYGTPVELGTYSVAWNLMVLIDLVTASLMIVLMPMAAKASTAAARAQLRRRTLWATGSLALLLLPLLFLAEPLVAALFPAYGAAVEPFKRLFWSSMVLLLVYPLYLGFYAQNRAKPVTAVYAAVVLTGLVVGPWLVPAQGAMGAANTTLVARVVGALLLLALLAWELRRPTAGPPP